MAVNVTSAVPLPVNVNDPEVEPAGILNVVGGLIVFESLDTIEDYLDEMAASGLSYSTVDHLRWDLKQVFDMAVAEGFLLRNPAQLLFTPRECPRPTTRSMTIEEVRKLNGVLGVRERLIARLAIGAGMRPGEIFALTWQRLEAEYADIRQRVYRGDIDSPKSTYSVRWAALSDGLLSAVRA